MPAAIIVSYSLSLLGAAPLILAGVMNLSKAPVAIKNTEQVGYPVDVLPAFGIIKIVIGIMTLVPATSFLGVILATGWMGGAIAAHVRIKDNYFLQVIIPLIIWIGFGLRHQAEMHSLFGF